MAWDMFSWATWRNPFFTERIGTSGFDPRTHSILSKLNRFIAPDAHRAYKKILGAETKATKAAFKLLSNKKAVNRGLSASYLRFARGKAYDKSMAATAKTLGISPSEMMSTAMDKGGILRRMAASSVGDSPFTSAEAALKSRAVSKYGGRKAFQTLLSGSGSRVGASLYIAGRVATAAGGALLAYDFAKLGMAGFEAAANYGQNVRLQPTTTWGSGIMDTPRAATMRQEALAQMHGSEFGPRRLIGNEAQFLHV